MNDKLYKVELDFKEHESNALFLRQPMADVTLKNHPNISRIEISTNINGGCVIVQTYGHDDKRRHVFTLDVNSIAEGIIDLDYKLSK